MERKVCVNASNPYHVCAGYCSGQKASSRAKSRTIITGGRTPVTVQNEGKTNGGGGGERRHVDPACVNASNPFHQCSDYCSGKTPGAKKRIEAGKPVVAAHNGAKIKPAEGRHVDPSCTNASNPFHRCGENCAQRMNKGGKKDPNSEISKLEGNDVGKERNVGLQCVNASDPLHQCAEHCFNRSPGSTSSGSTISGSTSPGSTRLGSLLAAESIKEIKEKLSLRVDGKADPSCKNASNPFHVCAYYCSQRSNDMDRVEKGKPVTANGSRSPKLAAQRRGVDPRCVNAGNPFHVCAEYCFEKIREAT